MFFKFPKSLIPFFITLFLSGYSFSQQNINAMLDSMSIVKSDKESLILSLRIADYLKYEDWKRAEYYLNFAKSKAEDSENTQLLKIFYKSAAEIYQDRDALDISISYLIKEYEFYKTSNYDRRFEIENQLGVIYARLNDKTRALHYFQKLSNHYLKTKNFFYSVRINNNIGTLYLVYNQPDSALIYFNKSLSFLSRKPNRLQEIFVKTNIGRTYSKLAKYVEAEEYFVSALDNINDSIDSETKSWVYCSVGKYYLETKSYDKAIEYSLEAEKYEPSKNSFGYKDVLQTLYKATSQEEIINYRQNTT